MLRTSEQINELASALAEAQGKFTNPERNREVRVQSKRTGTNYTFCYSTLDCVMDMARPHLSANGLSLTQPISIDGDFVVVTTRLTHSSGQWIETEIRARPEAMGPQEIGSISSYLRRYSACGILSIASDDGGEDDDGNYASGNTVEHSRDRSTAKPAAYRAPLGPCPQCGHETAPIVGRPEYGGGLVCFKSKGGCGFKWSTAEHPSTKTDGDGTIHTNGHRCKEYGALSKLLKEIGAKTPEEATVIVNWAVPESGPIAGLEKNAQQCSLIVTQIESCGMSHKDIYAESVLATQGVI